MRGRTKMEVGFSLLVLLACLGMSRSFVFDSSTCAGALTESFGVCSGFFNGLSSVDSRLAAINQEIAELKRKADLLSVRIVNGTTYRGEVELFVNGYWGAICDQYWDQADADVVCMMLGYNRSRSLSKGRTTSSPYQASSVNCVGNEPSIFQCSMQTSGNSFGCDYNRAAGVDCEMGIRLVGSSQDKYRGRVEVQQLGEWGSICDTQWTVADAVVVCRMLGLRGGRPVPGAAFGAATGRIMLSNVNCQGNENHLMDCAHEPFRLHSCYHDNDVSVVCDPHT